MPFDATRIAHLAAVAAVVAWGAPSSGDDWPMWGRDATRNMVSPEKGAPVSWSFDSEAKESDRIQWRATLGSVSCGTPVVADGLVWVGTNNDRPRDPEVKPDAGVLMCFRESDGEFLYQYVSPRLDDRRLDWPRTSLASSPLIEGDRLWFCTNRCEAVCLDIGPLRRGEGRARLVWKVDMIKELGVVPCSAMIGTSATHCSPAAYKNVVFVNTTNGKGPWHGAVPAPDAPSLLCFDKHTGAVVWQDNSPGKHILHVQYGSPLVLEIDGLCQVISAQGDGWIRAFEALTGMLIWEFDMNFKHAQRFAPGKGDLNHVLATPVYYHGRVYIASGRETEMGDGPGRLCCIDPTKRGDVSAELDAGAGKGRPNPNSGLVWDFVERPGADLDRMHRTHSTVAVHAGLVIVPDSAGYVHCLDAATGEKHWTHDTESVIFGSPMIADGKVYLATEDGQVLVFRLAKKLELLATNEDGGLLYATPVFANGRLYVMGSRTLYAIGGDDLAQPRSGPGPAR